MVYSRLYIVEGIIISRAELQEIDGKCVNDDYNLIFAENVASSGIDVFGFGCCSDNFGKDYIIGIKRHVYYRYQTQCGKTFDSDVCGQKSFCQDCTSITNNGKYPVYSFSEKFTECNSDHICNNCYADNRDKFAKCKTCGCSSNLTKTTGGNFRYKLDNIMKRFFEGRADKQIKMYYMLDDCPCV